MMSPIVTVVGSARRSHRRSARVSASTYKHDALGRVGPLRFVCLHDHRWWRRPFAKKAISSWNRKCVAYVIGERWANLREDRRSRRDCQPAKALGLWAIPELCSWSQRCLDATTIIASILIRKRRKYLAIKYKKICSFYASCFSLSYEYDLFFILFECVFELMRLNLLNMLMLVQTHDARARAISWMFVFCFKCMFKFLSRFTAFVLLALQRFNLFFEFPSFQAILASSSYSKAFETFSLRVHNFVDIRKKNKCV